MNADPKVIEKVLSLMREWGWETGLEKLKSEIRDTDDIEERAPLHFFVAWMLGEMGGHKEAEAQFRALEQFPAMTGWALVAQGFVALRQTRYQTAHEVLDQAAAGDPTDKILRATIHHCRGSIYYHQGKPHDAFPHLNEALHLFGTNHFGTGRVLDTLGMFYASRDNFHAAREFYEKSLELKEKFEDVAGLALTHGQLGRLYLDWGYLDQAKEQFEKDLEITQRIGDLRGEAQMYDSLGRVALLKGNMKDAASWLDRSIRNSQAGGWTINEGYARKDRALVYIAQGEMAEADEQIEHAQKIFQAEDFSEGTAYVNRARGMALSARGRHDEAKRALIAALTYFESHKENAEMARTQLEIARALRAGGEPHPMITSSLVTALKRAESCRRYALVREIEEELKQVDMATLTRHIYSRARGQDVSEDTVSLVSGAREHLSVMFLDIQGSTEYARTRDPEEVMMTLNQMMADFAAVLERGGASVTEYLGDGFMALVRGPNHADRSVAAALDLMEALDSFNRPRVLLGLKPLNARIGIATGEVFLGNVGTYQKMNYTAIGTTANLAARLQSEAEPGLPCIARDTYNQLPEGRYGFKTGSPRTATLKGLDEQVVWDVVERNV
jgi:class 3 adenylate cyclase/Flp pilus assembly protein TadD